MPPPPLLFLISGILVKRRRTGPSFCYTRTGLLVSGFSDICLLTWKLWQRGTYIFWPDAHDSLQLAAIPSAKADTSFLTDPNAAADLTAHRGSDAVVDLTALRGLLFQALEGICYLSDAVAPLRNDNARMRRERAQAQTSTAMGAFRNELRVLRDKLAKERQAVIAHFSYCAAGTPFQGNDVCCADGLAEDH
nr:uncharacterized protein LOC129385788 [Dermacentor andersoni]